MERQHLNASLQQLHGELQQVELVNESERQILEQVMADIQGLLEKKEGHDSQKYKRLGDRLKKSMAEFGASHPTATTLMGETLDLLAKMGI